MNKWELYEIEKKKIQDKNLKSDEYSKAIQELCKKLKI